MPSRLGPRYFGCPARVNQVPQHALLDQRNTLPGYPLAVKRRSQLTGMVRIVGDADVLPDDALPDPLGEARTLVLNRRRGKIVKEEPDQVEHFRRLQNHGVMSGR